MAIIRTTVLGGDDAPVAVTVDHDPTAVATDVPEGSLIIATAGALPPAGVRNNWYRKLDNGSTTNVQLVSNMNLQGVPGGAGAVGENVKYVGGTGGAGAGGDGGTALFDAGAAGGGVAGVASLGTTNAEAVRIGRTAKLTSLLGELSEPQTPMTLVNGDNIDIDVTAIASPATGGLGKIYYRVTGPTGAFQISGFADTVDGRVICVQNMTSFAWTIKNEAASELTASRRILTLTGSNLVLSGLAIAWFIYDATAARWIVFSARAGVGGGNEGAILQWGATNVGAGTRYLRGWIGTSAADAALARLNQVLVPGSPSRLLKNAHVNVLTAPGVGSITLTVMDTDTAGVTVATPIVVVLAGAATFASNLVDTYVVLSGHRLSVEAVRAGGAGPPNDTLFSLEAA